MRRFWSTIMIMFCMGCSSAVIPGYLLDKHPYTQRFYADFDECTSAVRQALTEQGWQVETQTDPAIYEQGREKDPEAQQILYISNVRVTAIGVGSRYARVNAFINSKAGISEVELRYMSITDLPAKDLRSYRNDGAAKRTFARIQEILDSQDD